MPADGTRAPRRRRRGGPRPRQCGSSTVRPACTSRAPPAVVSRLRAAHNHEDGEAGLSTPTLPRVRSTRKKSAASGSRSPRSPARDRAGPARRRRPGPPVDRPEGDVEAQPEVPRDGAVELETLPLHRSARSRGLLQLHEEGASRRSSCGIPAGTSTASPARTGQRVHRPEHRVGVLLGHPAGELVLPHLAVEREVHRRRLQDTQASVLPCRARGARPRTGRRGGRAPEPLAGVEQLHQQTGVVAEGRDVLGAEPGDGVAGGRRRAAGRRPAAG